VAVFRGPAGGGIDPSGPGPLPARLCSCPCRACRADHTPSPRAAPGHGVSCSAPRRPWSRRIF